MKAKYKSIRLRIPNEYCDKDYLMEMSIITLLCDFFEKELSSGRKEYNPGRWDELESLYNYFKPMVEGDIPSEVLNNEERHKFEQNLIRTVELRGLLWT